MPIKMKMSTLRLCRLCPCTLAIALTLLGGAAVSTLAQAQSVFLCVDANGRRELTDTFKAGCKTIDLPGTIAAPSSRKATPGRSTAAAPVSTPAAFPKVDAGQQKARDNDRRDILSDELRAEQQRLAELRAEYKNGEPDRLGNERNYAKYQARVAQLGEAINRSQANIDALNRELASIK